MPGMEEGVKAQLVLEINNEHEIAARIKELYGSDQVKLAEYTKLLYGNARIVSGLSIENPSDYIDLVTDLMV